MPRKTPQDWDTLEQQLYAAGVDPADVEAGARRLLAEARSHQLAGTRKHHPPAQGNELDGQEPLESDFPDRPYQARWVPNVCERPGARRPSGRPGR
jgi:hypothetical protein